MVTTKKYSNSRGEFETGTKQQPSGYTLIELLTVIAIISILVGILVPMISRSLSKNKLSSDIQVWQSKLEETRLLAGSAQTNDTTQGADLPGVKRVGYYGILVPTASEISSSSNYDGQPFYAIVRLSKPFTTQDTDIGYCNPNVMVQNALAGNGACLVERVDLSPGVTFAAPTLFENRLVAYSVPTEQLTELYQPAGQTGCNASNGYCWVENANGPVFDQKSGSTYFNLNYIDKVAMINIEAYTGKLQAQYQ